MFELLSNFIDKSHPVTLGVLLVLFFYLIIINWVFFYRWLALNQWISQENETLESLLMGSQRLNDYAFLSPFLKSGTTYSKALFDLAQFAATKEATNKETCKANKASAAHFFRASSPR